MQHGRSIQTNSLSDGSLACISSQSTGLLPRPILPRCVFLFDVESDRPSEFPYLWSAPHLVDIVGQLSFRNRPEQLGYSPFLVRLLFATVLGGSRTARFLPESASSPRLSMRAIDNSFGSLLCSCEPAREAGRHFMDCRSCLVVEVLVHLVPVE
jgi:hypothetical protein|eukprot:COSAG02_NODE_508_length_20916_cov_162.483691_16_plen_154_part_00